MYCYSCDIRVVGGGGAVEYPKSGAIVACLFIDRSLGAGGYFVFSYRELRRDGSSYALVTSRGGHAAKK
jgi:hypothetical protein